MRFHITVTLTLAFLTFAPAGCDKKGNDNQPDSRAESPPQTTAPRPSDNVRRISIAELQAALSRGEAVIVDVRGAVEYDLGHIKGARSVPLGLIAQKRDELPRDKLIVTYCA